MTASRQGITTTDDAANRKKKKPQMTQVLPAGWSVRKDPATGKTFYYNKAEKRSSWRLPTAGPAADVNDWRTFSRGHRELHHDARLP